MLGNLIRMLTEVSTGDLSASEIIDTTQLGQQPSGSDVALSSADIIADAADKTQQGGATAAIVISLLVFVLIMLLLEIARSKYVLQINRQNVILDKLPDAFDGIKIALISDLHQMEFGEYNTQLAKKIKLEEPDYIFFAGDMGDAHAYSVDAFYDLLESLGSDIPLIVVPGNHDLRLGGGKLHKNVVDELANSGAVLLNNACAQMALGDEKIYVYGFCPELEKQTDVDIKHWMFEEVKDGDLESKIGQCPDDAPVLLLTHDPTPFPVYAKWGADLVLAGHLHGGLIRLPFIGGLCSPAKKFFPKYTAGEYTIDSSKMFVTRGLGGTLFFRFGNAPEVSVLTLTRKPVEESKRFALLAGGDDNVFGISDEVRFKTAGRGARSTENPFANLGTWFKNLWAGFRSDMRSLRDLLHERSDALRDWIDSKLGKEKNRFAKKADEEKAKHTYISPKNRAKQNARKIREGGERTVTETPTDGKATENEGNSVDSNNK